MGKPGQPAAVKPTVSKRAATSTTKSCTYTCSTCTHTCSYYTCTFLFYFIGRVGQNDDITKYAILAGD